MLKSISISNFKAIGETPLILNGLTKVNYLVGPNGCGKSSVLEYLNKYQSVGIRSGLTYKINKNTIHKPSFIKYIREKFQMRFDGREKKWVFGDNFDEIIIDLIFKDEIIIKTDDFLSQSIPYLEGEIGLNRAGFNSYVCDKLKTIHNKKDQEFFQPWQIDGWQISEWVKDYITIDTYNPSYNVLNLTTISISQSQNSGFSVPDIKTYLNQENLCEFFLKKDFIKEFSGGDYKIEDYQGENKETGLKEIKFKIVSDYKIILFEDLATGYHNLFLYYFAIKDFLKKKNAGFSTCQIEEPETGLHPKLQKLLPQIFEDLSKEYFVTFLISTHSPFIISAAAEFGNSQKVYMIENGICVNPEGNSGNEVKHRVATKMLGARIKDFTPSKVVFCADSEKIFLELINESFYNLDIIFITPTPDGGDSSILKLAENTGKFANNFYPDSKIYYYTDKLETRLDNKANKLRNQSEFELITSNEPNFEAKFEQEHVLDKKENAKFQAEELIKMKENGKKEFEKIFPELKLIFDK